MSMTISFTWHEVDKVLAAFERAVTDVPKQYTQEGLAHGARRLQEIAGGIAVHRSGRMAGEWAILGPETTGWVTTLHVGPVAPYARRQELGYRGRRGAGKGRGSSPAHPFMRPALEALVAEFGQFMAAAWNPRRWAHG